MTKKCVFAFFTIMAAAILMIGEKDAYPAQDMVGSMRPALWRSSRTASADNFVLLATGSIHFHDINIGSRTVNVADSRITLYNSTTTNTLLFNSSAVVVQLGNFVNGQTSSGTAVVQAPDPQPYDMFFSSGVVYDKTGVSDINILWDFIPPKRVDHIVPFQPQ